MTLCRADLPAYSIWLIYIYLCRSGRGWHEHHPRDHRGAPLRDEGVRLQPDHQHVRGRVQHRHRHQPRGGHRVGHEEGQRHEDLHRQDGGGHRQQPVRRATANCLMHYPVSTPRAPTLYLHRIVISFINNSEALHHEEISNCLVSRYPQLKVDQTK